MGNSKTSSDPPSCRRRAEDNSNCTKLVFRVSVRESHPGVGNPAGVRPRKPTSDHRPQARGVSHDTRELTESAARSPRRDTSTGIGRTCPHRKSFVKAAPSRSHFAPLIRSGFSGATHRQCR
ncbi:hypothetical protein [Streptomyces sp. AK08-02]|uniref:hypothetical protein n=1 Tax=Streptomyces sp. AK08-02 TaxID=3028654 RepID=UPI0029BFE5CD|nr:hypothetical protein [Streptomyces sp. AK08-02]